MRISELNVIEFGGITDRRYHLRDGLNIFEGDNEAGKSTLWLFVKFMLYGMPKKGHPERERSVSRTGHRASGVMTLVCKNEEYRIERSFSEGARGRVATYRLSDGEKVFDGQEPGEALLGVPRDIFENSVGIGQAACAQLGGEKGAAAIRNILSSADESVDIEKIEKKLEAIRVYYRHRNGRGGKLYELSESISATEARLAKATAGRLKIVDIEGRLARNSQLISENEEQLAEARGLLGQLQKQEMLKRFERLAKSEAQLSETRSKQRELREGVTPNGYVPTAADAANLSVLSGSLERGSAELAAAKERLAALEKKELTDERKEAAEVGALIEKEGGADAVLRKLASQKRNRNIGAILMSVGGALALLFVILSLAITPLCLIGAGVSCIGIAVGGIIAFSKGAKTAIMLPPSERADSYVERCAQAFRDKETMKEELLKTVALRDSAEERVRYITSSLEKAMLKIGVDIEITPEGARAEADRLKNFLEHYGELAAREKNLTELTLNERELLSAYDESALKAELSEAGEPNMSFKEAEERQRFCSERLKTLKIKDTDLRTELINLKAVNEDPAAIKDELAALRKRYDEADSYYQALVTAIDGINRAAAAMQGNITPIIGRNASRIVEYISDGRYEGVSMGRSMDITLVDKDGLTTTTDMMSGGMKDAAYFALRIALMNQIYGADLPTLIMDEVLCQLDDSRAGRVLGLIGRLCDDGLQCMLFTCHKREARICGELGIKASVHRIE